MAARKRKLTLDENWRYRIKAGVIMDRLVKCINGTLELTNQQLKAADIVLAKLEPDLARSDSKSEVDVNIHWPLGKTKLDA